MTLLRLGVAFGLALVLLGGVHARAPLPPPPLTVTLTPPTQARVGQLVSYTVTLLHDPALVGPATITITYSVSLAGPIAWTRNLQSCRNDHVQRVVTCRDWLAPGMEDWIILPARVGMSCQDLILTAAVAGPDGSTATTTSTLPAPLPPDHCSSLPLISSPYLP